MYDLSGIKYALEASCLKLLLAGIVGIALGFCTFRNVQKQNPKRKNRKQIKIYRTLFCVGAMLLVFCVGFFCYYTNALNNPVISSYEGVLERTYTRHRLALPSVYNYVLDNGSGEPNPTFYLDRHTDKEILPAEFEIGVRCIVYYEENTKIIVRVDILE